MNGIPSETITSNFLIVAASLLIVCLPMNFVSHKLINLTFSAISIFTLTCYLLISSFRVFCKWKAQFFWRKSAYYLPFYLQQKTPSLHLSSQDLQRVHWDPNIKGLHFISCVFLLNFLWFLLNNQMGIAHDDAIKQIESLMEGDQCLRLIKFPQGP